MKKYITSLFIIILIIPSIAFASWWNPLSWNIFSFLHKKEATPQVEVQKSSDEKIADLQKQLDDLINKKENSIPVTIPVAKETTKNVPIVDNSEIIKKQVQAQLEVAIKAKAEQDALAASQNSQKLATQTVTEENNSDAIFKVVSVGQTIYQKPYVYGSYGITIGITTGKDDIYIPKSTSDSTRIYTGFIYSLIGDSFRGNQSSEVGGDGCGTTKTINKEEYCKIKSGESTTIKTTVWLTPEQSGNYGVMFDTITYLKGANYEQGSFDVNKGTQKIYLQS